MSGAPTDPPHGADPLEDGDQDWITDELDLHTFRPSDVSELLPDYIDEAVKRGYDSVRIIHGKGKGTLRRIVHAALERHPAVDHFQIGDQGSGAWGATLVTLRSDKGAP